VGSFNLYMFFYVIAARYSFLYEDLTLLGALPPPRGHPPVAITTYDLFYRGVPRDVVPLIFPVIEAAAGRPSGWRQASH